MAAPVPCVVGVVTVPSSRIEDFETDMLFCFLGGICLSLSKREVSSLIAKLEFTPCFLLTLIEESTSSDVYKHVLVAFL